MVDQLSMRGLRNLTLSDAPARPATGSPGRFAQRLQASTAHLSLSQPATSGVPGPHPAAADDSRVQLEERIAQLTLQQDELSARITGLKREAFKIKDETENKVKDLEASSSRRAKELNPDFVKTPRAQAAFQAELQGFNAEWGLNTPTSEERREKFFDVLLERLTEPVTGKDGRQLKRDIASDPDGAYKALASLLAYLHPKEMDTSALTLAASNALEMIKVFPTKTQVTRRAEEATDLAMEHSHQALEKIFDEVESRIKMLQQKRNAKSVRLGSTIIKEQHIAAMAKRYHQLANLILRDELILHEGLFNHTRRSVQRELDINDQQKLERSQVDRDSLARAASLVENQAQQKVLQEQRDKIAQEMDGLRQQLDQFRRPPDKSTTPTTAAPPVDLPSHASSTPRIAPETRLTKLTGELATLNEQREDCLRSIKDNAQSCHAAEAVIQTTQEALTQKRTEYAALREQSMQDSVTLRGLLTRQAQAREQIKTEVARIKNDPVINTLISEEAFNRVLSRHLTLKETSLQQRSFAVGHAGAYASFSVLLHALADVHEDASKRFPELMCAATINDFEQAWQAQQATQATQATRTTRATRAQARHFYYQHAETVGRAFHADAMAPDVPIDATTSAYSIGWDSAKGPVISHLYPFTRDR